MKKLLLCCLALLPALLLAQGNNVSNLCREIQEIKPDYKADEFKSDKKETVRQLREYTENKEKQLSEVEQQTIVVDNIQVKSSIDTYMANRFIAMATQAGKNQKIDEQTWRFIRQLGYTAEAKDAETFGDLDILTDMVKDRETDYLTATIALTRLQNSAKNIRNDIQLAHRRIDQLYGFLYDDGKFRIWITIIFSMIIGSLLILFFVFINKRHDTALAKDFLSSGNGLQFIALFSLIIAVILFGVLGILEGRELAAILSGISGYILGKGINTPKNTNDKKTPDKADSKTEHEKEASTI